jgi:hypothetical protein
MAAAELELLDFKRRVHALYARVRAEPDPPRAFDLWVAERDDLFAHHPQSALPPARRAGFAGLSYFPHDPRGRVLADVVPAERRRYDVPSSGGEAMAFERIGVARFALDGAACELELYWLAGYGGGLFVPFAARATRRTARGATCWTPSRARTSAWTTGAWCSTSTSPTTRRARTTRAGRVRWRRRRTGSRCRCAWASATSRRDRYSRRR